MKRVILTKSQYNRPFNAQLYDSKRFIHSTLFLTKEAAKAWAKRNGWPILDRS